MATRKLKPHSFHTSSPENRFLGQLCRESDTGKAWEQDGNRAVLAADRTNRGVVITFADGRSVLFRGELLYSLLPEADAIPDSFEEEEEEEEEV